MGLLIFFFFNLPNPASRTMVLGFTQPLTEMSTSSFWGVECGGRVELITIPPFVSRLSTQCGVLNISQPYRPSRPVTGRALLYGDGVCFLWGTNWTVSTTTSSHISQLTVSRMSRQCGILNISQPYRPPWPVTGRALLYGDGVCFLWGTNWTVSTATSRQYLAVNCEPIV
jgi:hypothetical protein